MIDEEIAGWFSQMKAIITTSGRHITINVQQRQQIIAALRRGHERQPLDDLDEPYFYLRGYRKRWRSFSHFNGNVISYDEVLEWSGIDSDREVIRERIYTITYAMPHGSKRRDGSLVKGESVEFESGMVFNISRTENA